MQPDRHPIDPRVPMRDESLMHSGRALREQRRVERQRRQRVQVVVGLVLAVGLIAGVTTWAVSRTDEKHEAVAAVIVNRSDAPQVEGSAIPTADMPPHEVAVQTTPLVAYYKDIPLRLPVALDDLTEVGFHQASYDYALHMTTPLKTADTDKAKKSHGTHRDKASQPSGPEAVLVGQVLRMWRARPGKPDSAADVGAAPGSTVYSPVDGTVVRIRPYKLYGRVDDFEIHIQPTGHPELDLVMIHVDELQVAKGDAVSAGVTPLAVVRKISDQIHTQLADYVTEGGNHAHFQINDVTNPDYKGLTKK